MNFGLTIAFWGVSMVFVIIPGADWAYAIASGLTSRSGVFPAVAGMLAGHLIAACVVATGLAVTLASSELAMTLLSAAGGSYLIWLGISALRSSASPNTTTLNASRVSAPHGEAPGASSRRFTKGIGISLLNPKVLLLFLALLPQFTSTTATWPVGAQMLTLGAVHVANCAGVYFAVAHGAAALLTGRPRAARVVSIVGGVVMVGLGSAIVVERGIAAVS
ncbi:LysE family translocator [Leucobacter luti]|uniref:LysE family translocator n=1 Tax=Leucobacter luti TaxID=340320 RepID=UPI001C68DC89|nr:LysE family translocator [Leucobacter luti]QYM75855.1 LysE family translocator [Leucobacter luti]